MLLGYSSSISQSQWALARQQTGESQLLPCDHHYSNTPSNNILNVQFFTVDITLDGGVRAD